MEKSVDSKRRRFKLLIIFVLSACAILLTLELYFRYVRFQEHIRIQEQKWALADKIEQKMKILQSFSQVPFFPCGNYHSRLQMQVKNYCPEMDDVNRTCLVTKLSAAQLNQISLNAEQMIYDCVKAQSDYQNQLKMGR